MNVLNENIKTELQTVSNEEFILKKFIINSKDYLVESEIKKLIKLPIPEFLKFFKYSESKTVDVINID